MSAQYGYIRSIVAADYNLSVVSGGSVTQSVTRSFALYKRNRTGLGAPSGITTLTIAPGQRLAIVLNGSIRSSSEELFGVVIGAAPTADLTGMVQLAEIPLLGVALPMTVYLDHDRHFEIAGSVPDLAALQALPSPITGEMKLVGSQRYRYAGGQWIATALPFSTYLTSTIANVGARGGSDRALTALADIEIIEPDPYDPQVGGLQSPALRVDLSHGLTADAGQSYPAGTPIILRLFQGSREITQELSGYVLLELSQYVDRATGAIDATVNQGLVPLQLVKDGLGNILGSSIYLPKALPRGTIATILIRYQFRIGQINILNEFVVGEIPVDIRVGFGYQGAVYSPAVQAIGSKLAFPGDDRKFMRIVPERGGLRRLTGQIASIGWITRNNDEAIVTGLTPNTSNQKVLLNAPGNGVSRIVDSLTTPLDNEITRAIVSTESGEYTFSGYYSSTITLTAGRSLEVGFTLPSVVRGDYPDVIAGEEAQFNVLAVALFVRTGGVSYRANSGASDRFSIPNSSSISIVLSSPSGWASAPTLPDSPATADFGLWGYPETLSVLDGGSGSLAAGTYEVGLAWVYTGAEASKISHSADLGCAIEFSAATGGLDPDLLLVDNTLTKVVSGDEVTLGVYSPAPSALPASLATIENNGVYWSNGGTLPLDTSKPSGFSFYIAFIETSDPVSLTIGAGVTLLDDLGYELTAPAEVVRGASLLYISPGQWILTGGIDDTPLPAVMPATIGQWRNHGIYYVGAGGGSVTIDNSKGNGFTAHLVFTPQSTPFNLTPSATTIVDEEGAVLTTPVTVVRSASLLFLADLGSWHITGAF